MDNRSNSLRRRSSGRSSGGGSSEVPRWDPFAQRRPQTNRRSSGQRLQRSRSSNRGFGTASRRSSSGGRPPRWDPFVHERPQRSGGRVPNRFGSRQQFSRSPRRSSLGRRGQSSGRFAASQGYGSANRFESRPQRSGGQFANRFGSRQRFSGSSRPSLGRRGQTGSRFAASQGYGSPNRFGSRRSGRREIKSIIGAQPKQWMASRGMSSQSSSSGRRRGASQPAFSRQRRGASQPAFSRQRRGASQPPFSSQRTGATRPAFSRQRSGARFRSRY